MLQVPSARTILYRSTDPQVISRHFPRHPAWGRHFPSLVAPYCAIPRDYLSDTPLLRALGFLVSQHGQLGAIPPPPFLSVSPLESMQSGGAIPPSQKGGISAILVRYPKKTGQTGAIPPSAILSRKGIASDMGGILHWAAKFPTLSFRHFSWSRPRHCFEWSPSS